MADPFKNDSNSITGSQAGQPKDELNARFQDLRRDAASNAHSAADSVSQHFGQTADTGTSNQTHAKLDSTAETLRDQASQAASEAKGAAVSIAEQARTRLAELVDQQKTAGADKIAGVAKAAQSAAGDLDKNSPQMARLVRTAADSVDRLAEDVRSRDIGDVLNTLAEFGRQQPVAFFGGAVVAGFFLARFFKSDAPIVTTAPQGRSLGPV